MAHARATPATSALARAGVAYVLHEYTHDRRTRSFGLEAAEALALDPARVFKTLVVDIDGRLVVAVAPVSAQVDLKAVAARLGGKKAAMAEPARAERATGYVLGGVSPIGQKRPHRTVLDRSVWSWDTVLVSGGRRGLDIELAPADLAGVTGATTGSITR